MMGMTKEQIEACRHMGLRGDLSDTLTDSLCDMALESLNRCTHPPEVGLPEGWVAVPERMTQDMAESAKAVDGRLSVFKWDDGYRAALEAAPKCPGFVSVPDGYPWTEGNRNALYWALAKHEFEWTDDASAAGQLARWLESAGQKEGPNV